MKNFIKYSIGSFLVIIQPKKAKNLIEDGLTIMEDDNYNVLERLMRFAILKNAEKKENHGQMAEIQRKYWVNKGAAYFEVFADQFETVFLPHYSILFDELAEKLEAETKNFDTLVEIGTGNGKVLDYCSSKFEKVQRFVGLDLSEEQIEINRTTYAHNKKLEFYAKDGIEWITNNCSSNTIFVTVGGVLEYFPQEVLVKFLSHLNTLGPTYLATIETNGLDHDFDKNPDSQPYGEERSFSHNHKKMYPEVGFKLWHHSKYYPKSRHHYFTLLGAKNF